MSVKGKIGPAVVPHMREMTPSVRLRKAWNNKTLFFMCLPAIVFFLVFSYIPMPGAYIAFTRFNYNQGIFGSPFIGFENFRYLFISGKIAMLTINTVLYNAVFILLCNVAQIAVAVMLNELSGKWFKKVSQSVMFLPHFISYVLVGLFAYNILSYDYGLMNSMMTALGLDKIKVYSDAAPWPWIITFTKLWKSTGYGSIVYFAAIMGLDAEMMEAAQIDGANALQRIRYILLPCLKSTFVILLLFSIGGILRGDFGLFYNLTGANNTVLIPTTDIIETFVFRALMNKFDFTSSSAVGLYQSVFGFAIVMLANWSVKRIEPDYALF